MKALIGVPSSAGARQLGLALTPRCLRLSGLVVRLRSAGHDVLDLGDLTQVSFPPDPQNPKQQNLRRVLSVLRQVASAVDNRRQLFSYKGYGRVARKNEAARRRTLRVR
jgi:hypothetical protein